MGGSAFCYPSLQRCAVPVGICRIERENKNFVKFLKKNLEMTYKFVPLCRT